MVYVPILKIELPEPNILDLIPATVRLVINVASAVCDTVDGYLHPLDPEEQETLGAVMYGSLPVEFRRARKRLLERREEDLDKLSEEMEDAAFAYYRRSMREALAGYSDEEPEDRAIRQLVDATSARELVMDEYLDQLDDLLTTEELEQQQRIDTLLGVSPEEASAALCGPSPSYLAAVEAEADADASAAAAAAVARLPRRSQTILTTTAAGSAGLALGVGAVQLVKLIRRLTRRHLKKQQQSGGGRQRSAQASPSPSVSGKKPVKRSSGKAAGGQRSRPATKKRS